MDIYAGLEEVAAALRAAGVDASVGADHAQLPGAVVMPADITPGTLDGSMKMNVEVYLLTRNNGPKQSMNDLSTMLTTLRSLEFLWAPPRVEPVSITLKNLSPDPLPGLMVTLIYKEN